MPDPRPKPKIPPDRVAYWKTNLRVVAVLLVIWFLVSYGCGVLFVDVLDRVRIPGTGFKLGFWFAQQGSIFVFVLLIAAYVIIMNRADHRHGVAESQSEPSSTPPDEDSGGSGI